MQVLWGGAFSSQGRPELNKRVIRLGMGALGLAAGFLMIHLVWQASLWPSLDDEPSRGVSQSEAPTDSWRALKAVMSAVPMVHGDAMRYALEERGLPEEPEVWRQASDPIEALSGLRGASPIVSPPRGPTNQASQTDLFPLITLAQAQMLRGWDRYRGGDAGKAAEDMLQADRLGQRLADGSQSPFMSVVAAAIQRQALGELQELLSVSYEPSVHLLVAERLPRQAPQEGRFRAVLERECSDIEALLMDPLQSAEVVGGSLGTKSLPSIFYDTDATVAQHRKWCREADAWMALHPEQRADPPSYLPEGISETLAYNRVWIEYLKVVSPEGALRMAGHIPEAQLQRDVLRLLTAARLYGYANDGELPAEAHALVPEFLPSLPLDPFTGDELEIEHGEIEDSEGEWLEITLPRAQAEP